jgi:hypothetical protein
MDNNANTVKTRCLELKRYWQPRNDKMPQWYRLIQQVDELKTDKMESFVGNDPRSMYNLVSHLLDTEVPHKVDLSIDTVDPEIEQAAEQVSTYLDKMWKSCKKSFRLSGPRQSLTRTNIGFMLATGWTAMIAMNYDDGSRSYIDVWNPAEVFPMWDCELGLAEVAHIFPASGKAATSMAARLGYPNLKYKTNQNIYDYWWVEPGLIDNLVFNAIVIENDLVKYEVTRHKKIPIYVRPVGGLPDTGALSDTSPLSSQSYNAGSKTGGERWKEEIGQSIVATNENIYKSWNKWWTFSLQLLRDTAQPRIFERSRSGKAIVKPEEVFRRGAIWRGGPDDSVDFVTPPAIPVELRSAQLDLEAMMQRGGPSWAMYGNVSQQITAYVMSQIAASANQVMRPFHQTLIDLYSDIDNDLIQDIRDRGISPYGWKFPDALPKEFEVSANFEIEIPGELVQKATTARMLDPEFRLSYTYVSNKLFPDIKSPMREKARIRADQAEMRPENGIIAYVVYARQQANFLSSKAGGMDLETARLYNLAADAAEAMLKQQSQPQLRGNANISKEYSEGYPIQ